MSSTADDSEESHAYFRAIEEAFIRLRGAPLLLSPADWRTAREWRREGIPLAVVTAALESLFERLVETDPERRVNSLRYCAPAVREAWSERRELAAADRGEAAPPLDPTPRLRALIDALPAALAERDRLARSIAELTGEPGAIEAALRGLDGEMVLAARRELPPERARAIEEEVAASLGALRERLPADQLEATRERLSLRALRHQLGLPWLSLFSPDAIAPEPSADAAD